MRLHTLGGLSLEGSALARPKPLLLLAYLAVEGPRERRHLRELFWPEALDPAASLRVALGHLRAASPDLVRDEGGRLGLETGSDVGDLLAALRDGPAARVPELYAGAFLDGLTLPDWGSELEEWVYATREFVGGRVRAGLLRGAEAAARTGDWPGAALQAEAAWALPGAPEPEPEDLERLYVVLQAAGHPGAAEVRRAAREYGLTLRLDADGARARLGGAWEKTAAAPRPLPEAVTPFVGRARELAALRGALAGGARWTSIVGPGGIGKTRLARELAADAGRDGTCDLVAWAALDGVAVPADLPAALAGALGLRPPAGGNVLAAVAAVIGTRRALLVLDNFEHLAPGAAGVLPLLAACPHLRLVVTSREALGLPPEVVLPLGGLEASGKEGAAGLSDAARLFMGRARRARLDFDPRGDELAQVRRIGDLVGGSPLALELAAAWIGTLSPAEIADELTRGLDLLETADPAASPRQRSLRATFEHSWALLPPREQGALRSLAVFEGGFSREAAAEVAGVTLGLLASLSRKSLLRAEGGGGRWTFHALLRHFCAGKLAQQPEEAGALCERHATFFLALAEEAAPHLAGGDQAQWLARLDEDHVNLRTAFAWARERRDAALTLRLGCALVRYWDVRGHLREGRAWLADALQGPGAPRGTALHARALLALGDLARYGGDYAAARAVLGESAGLFRRLNEPRGLADALQSLGTTANFQGDYAAARAHLTESLDLLRGLGEAQGVAFALNNLGLLEEYQGDPGAARRHYEDSLALWQAYGARQRGAALPLVNLGRRADLEGDWPRARAHFGESLAIQRALGDGKGQALTLVHLGDAALRHGEPGEAERAFAEALTLAERSGDLWALPHALEGLASVAAPSRPGDAARLWAAAEALRERGGFPRPPAEQALWAERTDLVRRALGDRAFGDAWDQGRRTPYQDLLALARLPASFR